MFQLIQVSSNVALKTCRHSMVPEWWQIASMTLVKLMSTKPPVDIDI